MSLLDPKDEGILDLSIVKNCSPSDSVTSKEANVQPKDFSFINPRENYVRKD